MNKLFAVVCGQVGLALALSVALLAFQARPGLFSTIQGTSTAATALTLAGGVTAGSGAVGIIGTTGKIPALTSTYFTSVSFDAGNLASGTIPDARFPATLPAVSGVNLTNLNASNVASGGLAQARLLNVFGAWDTGKTCDVSYLAATDLLVFASSGTSGSASIETESHTIAAGGGGVGGSGTMGVRKGQNWTVHLLGGSCGVDVSIFVLPIGG